MFKELWKVLLSIKSMSLAIILTFNNTIMRVNSNTKRSFVSICQGNWHRKHTSTFSIAPFSPKVSIATVVINFTCTITWTFLSFSKYMLYMLANHFHPLIQRFFAHMEYLRYNKFSGCTASNLVCRGGALYKSRTMLSSMLAFSTRISQTTANGWELASERSTPVHMVEFLVQGT